MTRRIFIPKPYQPPIMHHMLDTRRGGIFAGMGMGKTTGALTVIDAEHLAGYETKPALVLAPLRVAQNTWPDEAAKWEHLSGMEVKPITGSADQRKAALRSNNVSVFTINYENLPWLVDHLNGKWPFGRVIADESTKLKSFRLRQGGKRATAIARVAHTHVSRWTNLTGTPAPNGLIDLWGQTWMIDAGERLGRTFSAFSQRWFRPAFNGFGLQPLAHAQEEIEIKLRDICLSLDPHDYFDLAEPIVNVIKIDLPPKARAHYDDMEARLFTEIQGHEVEAFNSAAKSQKCLQIASGAAYIDPARAMDEEGQPILRRGPREWKEVHDLKMQALESVIEEAAGMPVLVAYHFNSTRDRLLRHFPKCRLLDKKPETLREWNAGLLPLLAAHPASAGHGLNLQDGGNIVVHLDHDWNYENFAQINERIGPMRQFQAGHDRPVYHHYIVARDTVDETVIASRGSKETVQNLLLKALKKRRKE